MVNGGLEPALRPRDLGFQGRRAGVELVHRPGIEILPEKGGQRVVGPLREKFFHVHKA